jgi:predicted acetyltransferase
MRREGYDVSMLYGIPSFYPKFGYAEAFPTVVHSMAVRDAERVERPAFRFVDYAPGHLEAVLKMYHRNNAGRTGPTLRPRKTWRPFRKGVSWDAPAAVRVALDSRGRPVGYFARDAGMNAVIVEVGFATLAVFGGILRAAADLAWSTRTERIRFYLGEDDAFMRFCAPYGLVKEVTYRRDGGAMVRMINVVSSLRGLAPVLGSRVGGKGRLIVRTNLDSADLRWQAGEMSVVPWTGRRASPGRTSPAAGAGRVWLPQWALAQLIYGYQDVASLAAADVVKGARKGLEALAVMFPPAPHHFHVVDEF